MFRNYIKIAWRTITRHKLYTLINVLGLALGICACLVIYLITSYEFSFDDFHPDKERIYRIVGEAHQNTGEKRFLSSILPEAAAVRTRISGFEETAGVRFYDVKVEVPDGNKPSRKFETQGDQGKIVVVDPDYFKILQYDWLAGDPATALKDPYKVVLTEDKAHKYFGAGPLDKMIGRTVIYNDSLPVSVSAIVKEWEGNTDLGYTDFISISTARTPFLKKDIPSEDWKSLHPDGTLAFVKLGRKTRPAQVNAELALFSKNLKLDRPGMTASMELQPLSDMHFTNDYYRGDDGDSFRKAHLPTLYTLMGIALFILIIASVNFINLSTAQSLQRAKEIGIRKVMGSKKRGLVLQFLVETFVVTLFAVLLSLLLVRPVLSLFSSYIPAEVHFDPFHVPTLIFLLFLTLATSLLAGFYPAKILSSYLPVLSLKGAVETQGRGLLNLRKGLIVFQFTISLVFIIGAIVIGNQLRFMRNADKGFKTDAIVTITNWGDQEGKMKVLAEDVKRIPGVEVTVLQGLSPMGSAGMGTDIAFKDKEVRQLEVSMELGNEDFIPFYRMKLLAGRNFTPIDSLHEYVINETFSKRMGFKRPEQAVGKLLYSVGQPNPTAYPIVGVVADFYQHSFHEAIAPMVIAHAPVMERSLAIQLAVQGKHIVNAKSIIAGIEQQWKTIYPNQSFNYSFLDESISQLFEKDRQTGWLMNTAMLITIFISCMGLFGLALFSAGRRAKEVGIRKVLGASVLNITALLSRDFIVLIFIAIFIASPIAWYFMNKWLLDFVYREPINGWVFLLAGLSAIGIGLLTVSFQAIKAAIANPVESLRSE